MGIKVRSKGSFRRTKHFLSGNHVDDIFRKMEKYAQEGADALAAATPVRTGTTASSWEYSIVYENGSGKIMWNNTNVQDHQNIAILIQYGHATGNGAWIEGIDYINPALSPVMDKIAQKLWKEVSDA